MILFLPPFCFPAFCRVLSGTTRSRLAQQVPWSVAHDPACGLFVGRGALQTGLLSYFLHHQGFVEPPTRLCLESCGHTPRWSLSLRQVGSKQCCLCRPPTQPRTQSAVVCSRSFHYASATTPLATSLVIFNAPGLKKLITRTCRPPWSSSYAGRGIVAALL